MKYFHKKKKIVIKINYKVIVYEQKYYMEHFANIMTL